MKRTKKILLWTAGIVVGLLAVAIIGLILFFPAEKVQTMLVEQASHTLNRDVVVGELELSLWGGLGVKLKEVTVGNPEGWNGGQMLKADAVDAKLRLWPLISGEYRVDRLIIEHPYLTLHKQPDGVVNYALEAVDRSLPPDVAESVPDETKTAMAIITFDRLEVIHGVVEYHDDSSGLAFTAKGLSLSTSLECLRSNHYQSRGEISIDSFVVVGDAITTTVALSVDYEAQYDHDARQLTLSRSDIGINELDLTLDGWAQLAPEGWIFRLDARSQNADVGDLLNLLPPERLAAMDDLSVTGQFDFQATIEQQAEHEEPLYYSGTAILSELDVAFAMVPGSLHIGRALLDFKPENLRLNIERGTFDSRPIRGHLIVEGFDDPVVNGELSGTLDLALVQPFLPPDGQHRLAGETDLAIKFHGPANRPDELRLSGSLQLNSGTYSSLLFPEPITSLDIEAIFDNDLIRFDRFQAEFESGHANFEGRLYNLASMMMADSQIAATMPLNIDGTFASDMDLRLLGGLLTEDSLTKLTGQLTIESDITGNLKDVPSMVARGSIKVVGGSYSDQKLPEPIESLDLDMEFAPDTMRIHKLNLGFTSSDLNLTGKVMNPWPYLMFPDSTGIALDRKPYMIFELRSTRLDVDKLFPEAAPGSGTDRASESSEPLPPVMFPLVDGLGSVNIDTLIYSRVEFTNISGKVEIKDRRIICDQMSASVYSGGVTGDTEIDFRDFENPHYSGRFQARQIEVDDFIDRFTKLGGHFFGKVNFEGNYDASGWDPEPFLASLTMSGDMLMNKGQVVTSGAVYSVMSSLADKVGETFSETQALRNFTTTIEVSNGRVYVNDLATSLGDMGDANLTGSYGFDGSLDYSGSVLLSSEWSAKLMDQGGVGGVIGRLFSDSKSERIRLPVKISRTFTSPKVELDYTALGKQATDNLLKTGSDLIDRLRKK